MHVVRLQHDVVITIRRCKEVPCVRIVEDICVIVDCDIGSVIVSVAGFIVAGTLDGIAIILFRRVVVDRVVHVCEEFVSLALDTVCSIKTYGKQRTRKD